MNYKTDTGKEKGSNKSYRNKKIKELKRQLAAVEAKTVQVDSDSDIDSYEPISHIKGRSKKRRYN